jgi:hypothetical protein
MEEEHLAKNTIDSIEKPKKPRSEKQLIAFEKARAKRVENAKIKKQKIDEIKEKAKNMKLIDEIKPDDKPDDKPVVESDNNHKTIIKKNKKKPKTTIIYQDESSDTDEELVIVKTKKEKKKSTDIVPDLPKVPIIKFI